MSPLRKTNPGRALRKDEVIVKGVREAVMRRSNRERKCDSCPEIIRRDDIYFRVSYKEAFKKVEMFHKECFFYEFTNR